MREVEALRETTGVVDGFLYQPHIYYLSKKSGKLVAYKKFIGVDEMILEYGELITFTKPLKFDKRRRTFEKIGFFKI